MITNVTLNAWHDDGNENEIELSPMQTRAVLKILGIEPCNETYITCYSDETLAHLFEMKGNPLRLIKKDQE